MTKKLSVIIPAYNEEEMVPVISGEVCRVLEQEGIEYEIVFVNDGSADMTWLAICTEHEKKSNIRGICLSRNFGKEGAIFAGLAKARGDCAVIMDCDLQHPPDKIPEMYRLWEDGYDVIEGIKENRGREKRSYGLFAGIFYALISKVTKIDMKNMSDFKLIDRRVINVLKNMPEKNVFFRALSSWVGFNSIQIYYDVGERRAGRSKWSSRQLIKYAIDNITSFSAAPLQVVTVLGVICFITAVVFGAISLVQYFSGVALGGFTTVIILELFIGSIIMTSFGVVGYYMAKIYEELKGRPRYIISGETGDDADSAGRQAVTGGSGDT